MNEFEVEFSGMSHV